MNSKIAEERYRAYLKNNKMFFTKERANILQAVLEQRGHFSVDELVYYMQTRELQASRATLYRSVSQLAEVGILNQADFGHGHTHYERADEATPHEHIICKSCGTVTEVSSPEIEAAIAHLASQTGFQVKSHTISIYGICSNCQPHERTTSDASR